MKHATGNCELNRYMGELESLVPQDGKSIVFDVERFSAFPNHIQTPSIEVLKGYQFINDSCRVDVLNFMASRKTYRYWALAILGAVFRSKEVTLELTHPNTQVRSMAFGYPGTTVRGTFTYLTRPHSFEYTPEAISEHPWMHRRVAEGEYPDFLLTFSSSGCGRPWEERDLLRGFGNDDASVMLAELLLNFGRDENQQNTLRLETIFSPAYRGVSRLSPEVRLHLPGSESWPG